MINTKSAANTVSAWQDAGFPFGFRFKTPLQIFLAVCSAMEERSVNTDQLDFHDQLDENYRPEVQYLHYPPLRFTPKHYSLSTKDMLKFMRDRIFEIAACYCDPDKAYDFDNYPELENWTRESLEDKLKEHYVSPGAFCDVEKYLLFIYKVLNLCCVRRVHVADEYGTVKIRKSPGDNEYDQIAKEKEMMLNTDYILSNYPESHSLTVSCSDGGYYILIQKCIRFLTWVDDKRPCDVKFYCYAGSNTDKFSDLSAGNVTRNSYFCAGVPDKTEILEGNRRTVLELPFPDTAIPAIPVLQRNTTWCCGFTPEIFVNAHYNQCYAYAVRDQRNYLKYYER